MDLRSSYFKTKLEHLEELQATVGDEFHLINFRKKLEISGNGNTQTGNSNEIEDVIECPCGQFKEEGTMIQVSKLFYFVCSCNKANSVEEPCVKCFAVHILKFEILQTNKKMKQKLSVFS